MLHVERLEERNCPVAGISSNLAGALALIAPPQIAANLTAGFALDGNGAFVDPFVTPLPAAPTIIMQSSAPVANPFAPVFARFGGIPQPKVETRTPAVEVVYPRESGTGPVRNPFSQPLSVQDQQIANALISMLRS